MKKFLIKFTLFLSPLILIVALHTFFVPADAIYFRNWEAFTPKLFFNYYSGPFYPLLTIEKAEKGDLAPHTDLAVTKNVVWQTDKYGFRTSDTSSSYDIVIVGDSNTVGSGLTQTDTLFAVLEKKLGLHVYPYAPRAPADFLQDAHFASSLPKVVIFEMIERAMPGLKIPSVAELETDVQKSKGGVFSSIVHYIKTDSSFTHFVNILDQSLDPTIVKKYIPQKITHTVPPPLYSYASGSTLFLRGDSANDDVSSDEVRDLALGIKRYQEIFKELGVRMVFMPIPNKENIYYKMLPSKKKPLFLEHLVSAVRAEGVDVIDLDRIFRNSYEKDGVLLYHTDDTHWNASAVKIASDAIATYLAKNPIQ